MDETQQKPKKQRRAWPLGNLILWLLLVPVVFGTLVLFSNLALVVDLEKLAADTRSLLQAQYQAWAYNEIPPINIAAFFSDIQKEIEQQGTPVVTPTIEEGTFWLPPTTEAVDNPTPVPVTPASTNTPTNEPVVFTPTRGTTPSTTPTTMPRTATLTPTNTFPPTATVQIRPTYTNTPEPEEPTSTARATATATKANTPTPVTPQPTYTATPTATLEYFPIRPIAENNGESVVDPDGQGCLAYFGYRNNNSIEIDIPIGERNYLSETPVRIAPESEQPTHFYTDRISPAFEVVWNNPVPFTWYLDGREAVVQWCNP